MLTKRLDRPLNVKIDQATLNDLESISRRLGLDKSEIARRALRVGLREFHGAELPGSPDMVRQEGVESAVGFLLLTGKRWWIFARCSRGAVVSIALPQHHGVHSDSGQVFCRGNCFGTGRVGSRTMRRSPTNDDCAELGTVGNGLARRTA